MSQKRSLWSDSERVDRKTDKFEVISHNMTIEPDENKMKTTLTLSGGKDTELQSDNDFFHSIKRFSLLMKNYTTGSYKNA